MNSILLEYLCLVSVLYSHAEISYIEVKYPLMVSSTLMTTVNRLVLPGQSLATQCRVAASTTNGGVQRFALRSTERADHRVEYPRVRHHC